MIACIFQLCLFMNGFESSTQNLIDLKFQKDGIEFVKPGETYCFNENTIKVNAIYSSSRITDNEYVKGDMFSSFGSKYCQKILKYFTYMILLDDKQSIMMLVNAELKNDYKQDNLHRLNTYSMNNFDCFRVTSTNIEDIKIKLDTFTNMQFWTTDNQFVCLIFNNSTESLTEDINFDDSSPISIEYERFSIDMKRQDNLFYSCPSHVKKSDILLTSNWDTFQKNQIICYDSHQHKFYDIEFQAKNTKLKSHKICYRHDPDTNKSCLRVKLKFLHLTLRPTGGNYSMIIFEEKDTKTKISYNIGDIFCAKQSEFDDKSDLLIGYHNKNTNEFCIVVKEIYGTRIITTTTTKTQITIKGCDVDPNQSMVSKKIVILPNGTLTLCVNRNYVIMFSTVFTYVSESKNNNDLYYHCSIEFPAKNCYYMNEKVKYAYIADSITYERIYVFHEKYVINKEIKKEYFYRSTYHHNHIICVHLSHVKNIDELMENNYAFNSYYVSQNDSICFIADKMRNEETIIITNIGGCTEREITITQNENLDILPSNDQFEYCLQFFYYDDQSKLLLKLENNDQITNCLTISCSTVSDYISISKDGENLLSQRYSRCPETESSNCIISDQETNLFIIYRIIDQKNTAKFLVMTNDELPIIISENYRSFYRDSYGKGEIVCFLRDSISNLIINDYPLKNSKIVCEIVEQLKHAKRIQITNFMGCTQEINLNPSADIRDTDGFQNSQCLFLTNDPNQLVYHIDEKKMKRCLELTCNPEKYLVEINGKEIDENAKIIDCKSNVESDKCGTSNKIFFIMVKNQKIPDGKYMYNSDVSISIKNIEYYQPQYKRDDYICFKKDKIYYTTKEWNNKYLFDIKQQQYVCVFARLITQDLSLSLNVNNFCNRSIVFKPSDSPVVKESWESNCDEFIDKTVSQNEPVLKKLEDIENCLKELCISLNYVITLQNEIIECSSTNCYSLSEFKYMKATSQYNNQIFYILPTDVFESFKSNSTAKAYYSDTYYKNDILCIKKTIHAHQSSQTPSVGVASMGEEIICYFLLDLPTDKIIQITDSQGCKKDITLYKTHVSDKRIIQARNEEIACIKFIKEPEESKILSEMSHEQLKKCSKMTCFGISFVVQKSKDHDDAVGSPTLNVGDKTLNINDAENFEYLGIVSKFYDKETYIKNPAKVMKVIPETYFYLPSYYKNESVCINPKIVGNPEEFNAKNSYMIDNQICIVTPLLEKKTDLKIIVNQHCNRTVGLYHDTTRDGIGEQISNENKCKSFIHPTNIVNILSVSDIKTCLVQTCSKVSRYVVISKENEPMISGDITDCSENDYTGSCLEADNQYDFIEIINDYVKQPVYFRTQDVSKINDGYSTYSYYKPSYGPDKVVCMKNDLFMNLNELKNKPYVFEEDNRACILNNKLEENLEVKYKINGDCNLNILLKKKPLEGGSVTEESELDACQSFISLQKKFIDILKISRENLDRCTQTTCASIRQVIVPSSQAVSDSSKKLILCDSKQKLDECIKNLDSADAIQIVSPFHLIKFYVSIKDESNFVVPDITKHHYFDEYYSDEIFCINTLALTIQITDSESLGLIRRGNKLCVVIKDIEKDITINMKQFNKCDKIINLKYNIPLEKKVERSKCVDFHHDPQKFVITMTKDKIKECIVKTCSKLDYLVIDDSNKIFQKSIFECSKDNGDISCIDSHAEYHFAKVTNPSLSEPLYVRRDTSTGINLESTNSIFYKSEYYNDKVVCIQSSMIDDKKLSPIIYFSIDRLKCIINRELKEDLQIIQELGSCNRTITLKNEPFSTQSSLQVLDEKCDKFLENPSSTSSVNHIDKTSLDECITHTCSVVHGSVDVDSMSNSWPLGKYKSCESVKEINTCLDPSKNYDFIKVTNHFTSQPIYFRTKEINTPEILTPSLESLYNSSYSGNDVVCFNKAKIDISSEYVGQRGIFNDSKKTCIVIDELLNDIKVQQKFGGKCTKDIIFSKTDRKHQPRNDGEFEKKCLVFISQSVPDSKIHDLPKSDILNCLDKTCSSISSVSKLDGEDAEGITQRCIDLKNVEGCLNNINDTDTLSISSPFLSSEVKIRKSDNDELRFNSSDVPLFYENDYYGDQVLCIRNDHFTEPNEIKSHAATREIGDKYCILINKLGEEKSITVKQFGKCEKTIKLHPSSLSTSSDIDQGSDSCHSFYRSDSESHIQMTIVNMKKCVESTCSKIKYFVIDNASNTTPVMQTTTCDSIAGKHECLDDVSKIHLVKISNEALVADITVITGNHENIDQISYDKHFYKQSLFQNDVVCVPIANLVDSSSYGKTVSFSSTNSKCIIATELKEDTKISYKTTSGCIRHMIITGSEKRKSEKDDDDDKACALFIISTEKTKSVDKIDQALFDKCFAHTCSKIKSAVELVSGQPLMQSERIVCNVNNNCLHQDKKYDFIKVTNDYLKKPIYLRTFDPENTQNYLPVIPFLYKNNFYENDVVCFRKDKLPKKRDDISEIDEIFTEMNRSCLLLSEVSSKIEIQLPIRGECSHNITLMVSVKPTNSVDKSEEMKHKCDIFFTESLKNDKNHIMDKKTILECLQYTCSEIESFVKLENDSDSYSSRSLTPCVGGNYECLRDVNEYENMKIKSPYRDSTIHVRSSADKSDNKKVSETTQYLDSYSKDDVVCIYEDLITEPTKIQSIISKFSKHNTICMTAKEVPVDTKINIKQYGHCDMTITINPSKDAVSDDECKEFYSTESSNPLTLDHSKLLKCINKTCSKVDYHVSNKDVSDLRFKVIKECKTTYGNISCIENQEEYQIIKVSNPSRTSPLFIKVNSLTTSIPPESDKSSKLPTYFYKSDYFPNDVVCIQTKDIINRDDTVLKNSYTIKEETCIIVKELKENKVIQVQSGKAKQTINLLPNPSSEQRDKANYLHKKCHIFIKQTETNVNLMHLNTLRECIPFTNSEIKSYHEIKENSPNSMIGKIEHCNPPQSTNQCIDDTKVYDYIKVESEFVEKPIYIRTRENTLKSSGGTIQKVYYKKAYNKNDIICFETNSIQEPSEFRTAPGFFVHEHKTCVLGQDLIATTDIKIAMTPSCSRTIQISNGEEVKETDETEKTCSHFISETQHSSTLPIYNKSLLSECLKSTCSRIVSYVPRNKNEPNSILKKVIACKAVTSDHSCLDSVTEYDALEVYSPITNHTFYVQSSTANKIENSFYMNAKYSESYYQDDVVCAHQDFVEIGIFQNSKVFFTNDGSHCFIVKESNDGDTLKIKLHGHCDKVIQFKPTESSNGKQQSSLMQQCQDFYPTNKKIVKMNLDLFHECVQYTCSKIDYFLNDFSSSLTDINTVSDCESKYGKSDCIPSKHPYIVKVTNPMSPEFPIYIYIYTGNEKEKSIDSSTLEKLFYKDQYGKDEFVCFKVSMIQSNHNELSIPAENSVKCFVGREIKDDNLKISMTMPHGCNRDITIHKSIDAPQEASLISDKCQQFYMSSKSRNSEVTLMDITTLKQCIIRTCSKVENFVQAELVDDISSITSLTKCNESHGKADCLKNEKNYDFVKITNSFLTTPLLYRTNEPFKNALTQRKLPLFYSSVYSENIVACFRKDDVLDQESFTQTWIYKEKSRICVLVSDALSTTNLKLKVTEECSRDITFNAKVSNDFQSKKESNTMCKLFYESKSGNLVSLTMDQLKTCLTITCSTINNKTVKNILDSCISDTDKLCKVQFESLRIEVESPYRNEPILVISPETRTHLAKLGNNPSKYSVIYSKHSIPCFASKLSVPNTENIVKFTNSDDTIKCYKFASSDTKYFAAITKTDETSLKVYGISDLKEQLESAYELHVDIFTFDSQQKLVSRSVGATVPFAVLYGKAVKSAADFEACKSSNDESDQIVTTNYTSFLRGYAAIIPQNLFLSHNLTFYVKKRKACAGYLEDSTVEIRSKEIIVPLVTYQCLPVFDSYLAIQLNTDKNQFNVTEDLDGKCVTFDELEKQCSHTHEFSKFITLCYSKGITPEEEQILQSKSENEYQEAIKQSLDIHVYLKNGECYNKKVTMSQQVGFCEIKEGFLQITLFSYESFTRTVIRKSMITPSEEYTLLVAIIFIIGLLVSYLLKQVNKVKSNQSGMQFHVPLMLDDSVDPTYRKF